MLTITLVDSPQKREWERRIRHKVFSEEQHIPEEVVKEGDVEALHFLAERGGLYVATGRYRVSGPFLRFERIATLKEARGIGVATELMLFMQSLGAEEFPFHLQILQAQIPVQLFYERLGWIPVGAPFEEVGVMHQLLLHPPKEPAQIKALLCLTDPTCPPEIKEFLVLRHS